MNKRIFCFLIIIFLALPLLEARAQEEMPGWHRLETRFATIYYENTVNLNRIDRKLRINAVDFGPGRAYRRSKLAQENVPNKIDLLFAKAQQILNMFPSGIHIQIKIFKRVSGLREEYRKIFDESTNIISFYIHKYNTVYLCEETIREGVVAHEFGHSIIDHYFTILPPRKVQEILATYVDAHLKD